MKKIISMAVLLCCAVGFAFAGGGREQRAQQVVVYSPFNDEFMQALSAPFTEETGIEVLNVVISTGESLSRLRAEQQRPQADFWLSVRPAILHGAFEEGLIEAYSPAAASAIAPAFRYPEEHITAIGTYPLVFFYNTTMVNGAVPAPSSDWADLVQPGMRDQVVMPHPATSGTAYSAIATILQHAIQSGEGEDVGWSYVEQLNASVAQFTRSGRAPQTLVAQGEYPVGIGFYDAVWQLQQEGYPVGVVIPDPVFAEPYGGAVVAGAQNAEAARRYFEYLLSPRAQSALTRFGNYPVVEGVTPPEGGVAVPSEQVIEIDFRWSSENRNRILDTFQDITQAEPAG
ncbi:MAG: extracellular solute-binding protein [Spirochaetaceae bacterium]|nr:MAG: extracellular solute-binding protein [Spirochaetaceae bacterium]